MPLRELRQALALAVGNRTGLLEALLGMFEQPGLVEKGVTPEELAAVTGNPSARAGNGYAAWRPAGC